MKNRSEVLSDCLVSRNGYREPVNVVDALFAIAGSIDHLANGVHDLVTVLNTGMPDPSDALYEIAATLRGDHESDDR